MKNLHSIRVSKGIWVTAYGKHIPVRELTDDHIKNILLKFSGVSQFGTKRALMLLDVLDEYERRGLR